MVSFERACPINIRSVMSFATSFWTSVKDGAIQRMRGQSAARIGGRKKRTIPQIFLPHTGNPCSVIGNLLPRSHEAVEDGAAVIVDDRDTSERRLDSFGSDSNHLTIHGCGKKWVSLTQ